MTVNEVIAAYLRFRTKKSQITAELEAKVSELDAKMEKLENWIREQADAQGVTSFKGNSGTAFITTTDYAQVADWDAMLDFIKTNNAYDMLEKRVSKTAVRGYIEMNKAVPAGVNYGTKLSVNVRKPTKKVSD